ncbi:MAG TPA: DUF3365 domain-containing protein [bacterium]|nr:DUF3365 domain-containing protein [bacterium]
MPRRLSDAPPSFPRPRPNPAIAFRALLGCLGLLLAAATSAEEVKEAPGDAVPESVPEAVSERAHELLGPFKKELLGALTDALYEGGPENAITVCRMEAPAIAAGSTGEGIEIGRTSHRLRNPDNAPAEWMKPLLAAYLEDPERAEPRAVRLEEGRVGYVEPMRVLPMCLACHGTDLAAPVSERLAELYPEDKATGFEAGDFRGMFWVTLPE